jgi:hypothetical protein|tara:strand:- start:1306 stop:1839 length:534 start_codon:yes stop_codon:yes gene_type:complete
MALDSDNVRVAVTGAVYVAPTTTTGPTTTSGSLDAAFVDLGYVSADGIVENIDRTTNQIRAWQNGSLVREVTSEGTYSVDMTFIETNESVLELYYGSTITTGALDGDPTSTGGRKSFVIDVVDGAIVERIYIPAGEITSIGTRTLASGEAVGYQVTISAYADAGSTTFKKFFSQLGG